MKQSTPTHFTAQELSDRWRYHRGSIVRLMRRFGCSGIKFGKTKQSGRRFAASDVHRVEKLAGLTTFSTKQNPHHHTTNKNQDNEQQQ